MSVNYIKGKNLLKLLSHKFSVEIQAEMQAAGEARSAGNGWEGNQKIEAIRKRAALPFKTRAGACLAWGIYQVGADSPVLLLIGILSIITLSIQAIFHLFGA